jgi:hypothetical protein
MKHLALAAFAALLTATVAAQSLNTEFQIAKITPDLVTTPDYSFNLGPKGKRVGKNKDWLEVEVSFDWQPTDRKAEFLDELTIEYFILLNNADRENRDGTLLTGSVTHVALPAEKGMNSVMYVSPRTLERFFAGKIPSTARTAVKDIGIIIKLQGRPVAQSAWQSKIGTGAVWWSNMQPTPGYVLNKSETPFAPLVWDYYEAIKARPAGM